MTDEKGPREEPVAYAGDTSTLEGGPRSTGAIKIVKVRLRLSPANNRIICLSTRLSSAARQKGPEIRTPRRSSPLVAWFWAAALVLLLLLVLHLRYTLPVVSSVTLQVLFYFLVCSAGSALVRHVSPFTSWGTSLRTNTFRGRTFPCPWACGFLPLPLLGRDLPLGT